MNISTNMIGFLCSVWQHTEAKNADLHESWYYGSWHHRTQTALLRRGLLVANPNEHIGTTELCEDGHYRTIYRDTDGNVIGSRGDRQSLILTDEGRKALADVAAADGLTIDQRVLPCNPEHWRQDPYSEAELAAALSCYDLRTYGRVQDHTDFISTEMSRLNH